VADDEAVSEVARVDGAFRSQIVRVADRAATSREGPPGSPLDIVHEFRIGIRNVKLQTGVPTMCIGGLQCIIGRRTDGRLRLRHAAVFRKRQKQLSSLNGRIVESAST